MGNKKHPLNLLDIVEKIAIIMAAIVDTIYYIKQMMG